MRKLIKPLIEFFPKLASIYRYLREIRHLQTIGVPTLTPMGFKFIGSTYMQQGKYEIEEFEIVKKILKEIDIFINVGANMGYYCCIALQFGKKVVAFEPIELNLKYLYKNLLSNNWGEEVEIFPIALSDKPGLNYIYGGSTGASLIKGWAGISEKYVNIVPTSTLDLVLRSKYIGETIFILVDIEGSEKSMLDGAEYFITRHPKPIWMIEIIVSEHQPNDKSVNPNLLTTFKKFWDNDYIAMTACKNSRVIYYQI